MNTPSHRADERRGEAGAQSQPLRRGGDASRRVKQRLGEVGLEDRGDRLDDERRDRRSSGRPPEPDPESAGR